MQRILQVNINNEGGAFSLVYQVQKRIDKKQFEFDYYTMGVFNRNSVFFELIHHGSNIYEGNLRNNRLIGHLFLPLRFYQFLKNKKYEKIHIHSDSAWKILVYAIPAKMAKVPCVIIHSHSTGINGEKQFIKKIFHMLARTCVKKFGNVFLACSTEAAKWMFGSKCSDVIIIKNGVDLNKFRPDILARKKIRKELQYRQENVVIGTVGDFSDTKNPQLLIDIFESFLNMSPVYRLLFIGTGENEKKFKNIIRNKGIQDSVIFMGRIENVQEVLNAMDAFVLPSKFEGLPLSAIEAQATGIPVFLSPNITREAGINGFSWYAQDYLDVNAWKNIIMSNIKSVNPEKATVAVRNAGFDINDTVKAFIKVYTDN